MQTTGWSSSLEIGLLSHLDFSESSLLNTLTWQPLGVWRFVAETKAAHCSFVISNLPQANCLMFTLCCGPSSGKRPGSLSGEPIIKLPAGTINISGQSLQSRNFVPGL